MGIKNRIIHSSVHRFILWIVMWSRKAPHMHNYPSRLDESNVKVFYLNSRKILNQVKNICLILFAFISIQMVRIGLGGGKFIRMVVPTHCIDRSIYPNY